MVMEKVFSLLGPSKVTLDISQNRFTQNSLERQKPSTVKHDFESPIQIYESLKKKSCSKSAGMTLLYSVVFLNDVKIALLQTDQLSKVLTMFQNEAAYNLEGEKQLYKKWGFFRRKGCSVACMKETILATENNDILCLSSKHVMQYMALLSNHYLIIFNQDKTERMDYGDPSKEHRLLIYKEKNGFTLIEKTEPIDKKLFKLFIEKFPLPNEDEIKMPYLRSISKVLNLPKMQKVDIIKVLKDLS